MIRGSSVVGLGSRVVIHASSIVGRGPCRLQFLLMTATTESTRSVHASNGPITLAIDIGGSGLKAMLLDKNGKPVSERQRVLTPDIPTPRAVMAALDVLIKPLSGFDRVSVGFPGVTKHGITYTAVNLHPDWMNFRFQAELEKRWKKPVRVANDAAIQGYGAVKGNGIELIVTLGTGMGSALFTDGHLCPLELGHHPWKKKTYEDYIGKRGLEKHGKKKWNEYVQEAVKQIQFTFNYDHLYLGGGNTKKIEFKPPKDVSIVSNETGLLGGVALWREEFSPASK
jgi:polyphosphate glucokinase